MKKGEELPLFLLPLRLFFSFLELFLELLSFAIDVDEGGRGVNVNMKAGAMKGRVEGNKERKRREKEKREREERKRREKNTLAIAISQSSRPQPSHLLTQPSRRPDNKPSTLTLLPPGIKNLTSNLPRSNHRHISSNNIFKEPYHCLNNLLSVNTGRGMSSAQFDSGWEECPSIVLIV